MDNHGFSIDQLDNTPFPSWRKLLSVLFLFFVSIRINVIILSLFKIIYVVFFNVINCLTFLPKKLLTYILDLNWIHINKVLNTHKKICIPTLMSGNKSVVLSIWSLNKREETMTSKWRPTATVAWIIMDRIN